MFAITGGNWRVQIPEGILRVGGHFDQIPIDGPILENKHPAWLDVRLVVTKRTKEQHKRELIEVLTKLEIAGCRLTEKNGVFQNRNRVGRP